MTTKIQCFRLCLYIGVTMKPINLRSGYLFSHFSGKTDSRIIPITIPDKLTIPLSRGYGKETPVRVKVGQKVKIGQALSGDEAVISTPVVSTVNGTVTEVQKHALVIEPDKKAGDPVWAERPGWEKSAEKEIRKLLYESGITALGKEGIPSDHKSAPIEPAGLKHIIISCIEDDIYNITWSLLLDNERAAQVLKGFALLHAAYPNAVLHFAVDKRHAALLKQAERFRRDHPWLELYAVTPRFPAHTPEILIPALLGMDMPWGYSPIHSGIIVIDIQTVLHCYEAAALGKPLGERIIALSGPGFSENPHVRVRIGTPVSHVVADYLKQGVKSRLVLNSPLMGEALTDLSRPVDLTFSQIIAVPEKPEREFLAFMRPGVRRDSYSNTFLANFMAAAKKTDTNLHGEQRPCIYCGYCEEVCPVGIIPHLIYHNVLKINVAEFLLQLKIFKCMHCNLCNYVCPVKLPLSQGILKGQQKLIEAGCDPTIGMIPYYDLDGLTEYRGRK